MRRAGPRGVLLDVPDAGAAAATAARVRALAEEGLLPEVAVVPGAASVLVEAVETDLADAVLPALAACVVAGEPNGAGPLVEVPVSWDGPDLDAVAGYWGCSPTEVVARLEAHEFRSAFCGFAPGFAYLAGLPEAWALPRLASPRPRVPAGSVALAGTWAGVYPTASPGGWQLVGRTEVVLFDADADPPALLAPGTRVRFVGR
ncbi:allophanate hydrolase subunit 1 [Nocardioides fonticola]|uniref:Allophanate hydrolase subunit 1 n=1 Tax=Nocardioides fonticola TaxID=450363 RepID=A0ABP7Y0Y0_9ACTN